MKTLKILVGNIGAGKTTYCNSQLDNDQTIILSKDDLRYSLRAGRYVYDLNLEDSIHACMQELCKKIMLDTDYDIIIDETNMSEEERKPYLRLGRVFNYNKVAIMFPEISKEESIKRRMKKNHGNNSREIWDEVWEKKTQEYTEPSEAEGFNRIILIKNIFA